MLQLADVNNSAGIIWNRFLWTIFPYVICDLAASLSVQKHCVNSNFA